METRLIREKLKTCTIYDLPLRVTFYARVSTDKDEQLNSLENQEAPDRAGRARHGGSARLTHRCFFTPYSR